MFQERSQISPLSSTRALRRLKDPSSAGEGLRDPTERPLPCGRRAPRFHVSVLAEERAKGSAASAERVPWVAGMAHGHGGHGDLPVLTLTKGPPHFGAQKMGKDLRGKG